MECTSLLFMRRNKFLIVQKSPKCRNLNNNNNNNKTRNVQYCLLSLHARFKVFEFSDNLHFSEKYSAFQGISIAVHVQSVFEVSLKTFCKIIVIIA